MRNFCSNYLNVPIIQPSNLVQIDPFPLVVHSTIVQINRIVPINQMSIKRSRLYE